MKPFFYSFFMLVAGCSAVKQPEIPAVTGFDASRYSGKWYEIARLPNYFEKDLHYITAEYTLLPDGKLQVVNSGIKKGKTKNISGIARFAGAADTGNLEVSFFIPDHLPRTGLLPCLRHGKRPLSRLDSCPSADSAGKKIISSGKFSPAKRFCSGKTDLYQTVRRAEPVCMKVTSAPNF